MQINYKGYSLNFSSVTGTTIVSKDGNLVFCCASDEVNAKGQAEKTNNSVDKAKIRIDGGHTDKAVWSTIPFAQQKEIYSTAGLYRN